MAIEQSSKPCTVVLHDDAVSRENVLCGSNVLPAGSIAYLVAPSAKALCIHSKVAAKNADEVSVHVSIAKLFGFENRMKAGIHRVENAEDATATHVEVLFRDQYLSRADMWRMKAQVDGSVLYQGQKLNYLGPNTASVEAVYVAGQEVDSAYIAHRQTNLIFRSGSARFTILIQVSKEMLEYWSDGDLMYERLIAGFLPDLFKRWDELKVRHSVTVVLFGRRLVPATVPAMLNGEGKLDDNQSVETVDFFHVLASGMPSGDWQSLLRKLKRAFNGVTVSAQTRLAAEGNMLQAIHLAAMDFAEDRIDPSLTSTGTSIVAVTAGAGLFCADYELLWKTTKMLMGNSVGVDIVSLSPKPLHPVPLFQYKLHDRWEYSLPHWADISYWNSGNSNTASIWLLPTPSGDVDNIYIPNLEKRVSEEADINTREALCNFDENVFRNSTVTDSVDLSVRPTGTEHTTISTAPTNQAGRPSTATKALMQADPEPRADSTFTKPIGPALESKLEDDTPMKAVKWQGLPPHPLMQLDRKISLGPRGLALSQGVASTTVSAQNAQQARESAMTHPTFATDDSSSGLAKQIRESLRRKPSQRSLALGAAPGSQTSKPIDINPAEARKSEESIDPASLIEKAVLEQSGQTGQGSVGSLSETPRANSEGLAVTSPGPIGLQNDLISPWLTLLNPCNPRKDNMRVASEYRQWQNVFPKAVSSSAFKWDSLCTPAVLPLMTESRGSSTDLDRYFSKKLRRLLATKDGARQAMLHMISMRLAAGFQVVPLRKLPHAQMPDEEIDRMLLWLGGSYHELRRLSDVEVQVSEYEPVAPPNEDPSTLHDADLQYSARVKPLAARKETFITIHLRRDVEMTDWSSLDDHSVNANALPDNLGLSRARFVLIPVDIPRVDAQIQSHGRELSDEERRLEGINRLTQLWQRNRFFSDEDERHTVSLSKPSTTGAVERDPNPLAIEYQTRDPSAVVSAYGTTLAGQLANGETSAPLFAESELYHSGNFDMVKLVKQMQEPPPAGVELRDRRWFTRLHLKCFRGDEMTNWLLRVFKNLQTREDAIALGNQLMAKDIFTHVRGKHEFRDGNYFYQIKSAHRTTDYPDTAGFFAKGIGRSVPTTPLGEVKQSPSVRAARADTDSSDKSSSTPTLLPADKRDKKEVMLSQMLQYNADPAKKSNQLEVVNLHYDRIHNPDNCYHIQLDWTNTTPNLIRESIARWTSLVESHGLKFVQVPLAEASRVPDQHPFDQPISVRLAIRPPDRTLATPHLDPHTFSPRLAEDPEGYHKALLRKMDFVLDLESSGSFPRRIDVSYSWGRPSYEYTQFVHKSGLLLAQIANNGKSDFLLLRNRLAPQNSSGAAKKAETNTVESLVQKFMAFCRNDAGLKMLFEEIGKPKISVPSPLANAALDADSEIPPIELPPHLAQQAQRPAASHRYTNFNAVVNNS